MDVYIYQAAIHCKECGEAICRRLDGEGKRPANFLDESSYDSDDYPKGPYADGGGEADNPQHCDSCGLFLENSLTRDGDDYVREAVANSYGQDCVKEWEEYYSYLF